MKIDLNDPDDFTKERVRRLIAKGDDSTHTQLRVSKNGKAFLSKEIGAVNIEDLAFRFETWTAENGYVGPDAAKDDKWVDEVYKDLKENWPNPKSSYIDF